MAAEMCTEQRRCVEVDGDMLRERLEILNPQVVVYGGTAKDVNKLIPGLWLTRQSSQRFSGKTWLSFFHPAVRAKPEQMYAELIALYQQTL